LAASEETPQPRLPEPGMQTDSGSSERTNNAASSRERLQEHLHSWGEAWELSKAVLSETVTKPEI